MQLLLVLAIERTLHIAPYVLTDGANGLSLAYTVESPGARHPPLFDVFGERTTPLLLLSLPHLGFSTISYNL